MFGGAIWDTGCYPITFTNIFLKIFGLRFLNHKSMVKKKILIGSTNVDMESELNFYHDDIKIKLKTSLINKLQNSIVIKFSEGYAEISNLLNIGELVNINLNINNKNLQYKLTSNLNIIQTLKNEILKSLNNKQGYVFSFPLVNNMETLENIKILEKWKN